MRQIAWWEVEGVRERDNKIDEKKVRVNSMQIRRDA